MKTNERPTDLVIVDGPEDGTELWAPRPGSVSAESAAALLRAREELRERGELALGAWNSIGQCMDNGDYQVAIEECDRLRRLLRDCLETQKEDLFLEG